MGNSVVQTVDTGTVEYIDADGDGYLSDEDCDDTNASVNPSASELCDGLDNDCNGEVDDGVKEVFTKMQMVMDMETRRTDDSLRKSRGYVPFSSDCDKSNASYFQALMKSAMVSTMIAVERSMKMWGPYSSPIAIKMDMGMKEASLMCGGALDLLKRRGL